MSTPPRPAPVRNNRGRWTRAEEEHLVQRREGVMKMSYRAIGVELGRSTLACRLRMFQILGNRAAAAATAAIAAAAAGNAALRPVPQTGLPTPTTSPACVAGPQSTGAPQPGPTTVGPHQGPAGPSPSRSSTASPQAPSPAAAIVPSPTAIAPSPAATPQRDPWILYHSCWVRDQHGDPARLPSTAETWPAHFARRERADSGRALPSIAQALPDLFGEEPAPEPTPLDVLADAASKQRRA